MSLGGDGLGVAGLGGDEEGFSGLASLSLSASGTAWHPLVTAIHSLSGLQAHWRLGESSGTIALDSAGVGVGRNGTYTGSPAPVLGASGLVSGDPNTSVAFASGTTKVQVNHNTGWMDSTTGLTCFAVIKTTGTTDGVVACIDEAGNAGELQFRLQTVNSGTRLGCYFHNPAGGYVFLQSAIGAIAPGGTYTVAVTNNGSYARLFINGVMVDALTAYLPASRTGNFYIGNFGYVTGAPFVGSIQDVAFADVAATRAKIAELHNASGIGSPVSADVLWDNSGSLTTPTWVVGSGVTTGLTALPSGSSGKAAAASGSAYIAQADTIPAPFTTSSAQTIELWFQKPAASVKGPFFKIDVTGSAGWAVGLGASDMDTNGSNLLLLREALAWHNITSVSTGNHHLVVTRSGTTIQIYLDGTSVYNANPGSINTPVTGMSFGGYLSRMLTSTVPLDKIALYNTVLSGARVTAHYNGGAGDDAAVVADSPIVLLELDPPTTGTASLSLSGAANLAPSATAALSLTAIGTAGVSGASTASLSLSGSGGARATGVASASLTLTGVQSLVSTASLSLSGSGATAAPVSATASLSLSGATAAAGSLVGAATMDLLFSAGDTPANGTATLTLSGSADSTGAGTSSAALDLSATGGAAALSSSASLSLSFVGAATRFPIAVSALTSGLTGWWRLNETGGTTAADSSGSSHPLNYGGSYTQGSSAVMSDGSNDLAVTLSGGQVAVAHAAWMDTAALTVFTVIQPNTVSGLGTIMCVDDTGGAGNLAWRVRRNGNRVEAFTFGGAGIASPVGSIVANVPYTVAYTNNGSTEKLYLNGVEVNSGSVGAIPTGTGALRIGALSASEPFLGKVDEALLWSTALTPTNVMDLHLASGVPNTVSAATASLSLSATGAAPSGRASNVTALLSTTAAGAARARIDGNAGVNVYSAFDSRSGTASLSFSATGPALPATARTATGLLSFSSTGAGVNSSRTGTGSLTFAATGVSPQYRTATGSITFSATGVSPAYRSATASISLFRTTGDVGVGRLGTASLTLAASPAIAGVARTASGSISLSGAGVFVSRSGTASLSLVMPPRSIVAGLVITQGVGEITLTEELLLFPSELRLTLLETVLRRAPAELTIVLSGAEAQTDVTFDIDGTDVYTVSADSNGELGPTTINVSALLGTAGTHTLTATQVAVGGTMTDSVTFTVTLDPAVYPSPPVVNAPPSTPPAPIVDTAQHWVLQDLLPTIDGGIGYYVFPHNPASMTSPHYEHAMTSRHSTAQDGKHHIFQAATMAKEWQFTGFCPTQAHQEAIEAFRQLNRRFWLIDHRNRAWTVVFTDAQFVPRLRTNYNGVDTDWGSDFTITAAILDQDFTVPS